MRKHPLLSSLFAAGLSLIFFTACQDDVYQGEPDTNIPENPKVEIDWSTYVATQLNINVADEYDGAYYYTVEAYYGNPLTDENAKMIAGSGQKTNAQVPYNRMIVIPDGVEIIFISVTDPFMRKSVYGVAVNRGSINLDLSGITTRSIATKATPSTPDTPEITIPDLSAATPLAGTKDVALSTTGIYVVEEDATFSGALNFGAGGAQVYVKGTLEWKGGKGLQGESGLYILDGGLMTSSASTIFYMVKESVLYVEEGGSIGTADVPFGNVDITSTVEIINNGTVYLNEIDMTSEAKLYNNGTMVAKSFITHDNDNPVVNTGSLIVDNARITNATLFNANVFTVNGKLYTNGATVTNTHTISTDSYETVKGKVDNYCKISANSVIVDGTTVNNHTAAYIYAKNTTRSSGLQLNMYAHAIWDGEYIKFDGSKNNLKGVDVEYSLFRVPIVALNGWAKLAYSGIIEVNYTSHDGTAGREFETEDNVKYTTTGEAIVEIPASDCNGESGNTNPGDGDGDDKEDYTEIETLPYTYMFEDNWPNLHDFDMNDIVVSVELRNNSEADKITSVDVIATLYAIGGTMNLGAGFQLDGVPAGNVVGAEPGQEYAVLQLFADAHAELGVPAGKMANTYTIEYDAVTIRKTITFNTPVSTPITVNNFNLFITANSSFSDSEWKEVHLPGFYGTSKAMKHEESTVDYLNYETGWMYAICVPQVSFATYPKETVSITTAYEGFDEWVAGETAPDWYFNPVTDKVIIYNE